MYRWDDQYDETNELLNDGRHNQFRSQHWKILTRFGCLFQMSFGEDSNKCTFLDAIDKIRDILFGQPKRFRRNEIPDWILFTFSEVNWNSGLVLVYMTEQLTDELDPRRLGPVSRENWPDLAEICPNSMDDRNFLLPLKNRVNIGDTNCRCPSSQRSMLWYSTSNNGTDEERLEFCPPARTSSSVHEWKSSQENHTDSRRMTVSRDKPVATKVPNRYSRCYTMPSAKIDWVYSRRRIHLNSICASRQTHQFPHRIGVDTFPDVQKFWYP